MTEKSPMEELKSEIAECKSALQKLEARAQAAEGTEKAAYEEQISSFRKRLIDVQDQLLEMSVDRQGWDKEIRQGAGGAWNRLKKGLKDAKTEFKKGYDEGLEK